MLVLWWNESKKPPKQEFSIPSMASGDVIAKWPPPNGEALAEKPPDSLLGAADSLKIIDVDVNKGPRDVVNGGEAILEGGVVE